LIRKVLYIEDDIADQRAFKRLIKKSHPEVELTTSDTLLDGKAQFSKSDFDAVFCDFNLPDGTAVDFLNFNSESGKNKLVVILTSFAELDKAVECVKLGAFDFFDKENLDVNVAERVIANLYREFSSRKENAKLKRLLDENTQNTRALINNITDGIWSIDINGAVLIYNLEAKKNMELHLNYSPQIGDDFFSKVPPLFYEFWNKLFTIAKNGKTATETLEYDSVIGLVYMETKCFPIKKDDKITGTTFYVRNITKRVLSENIILNSEKNFRAVFEGSSIPILVESLATHRIIDANHSAEQLHGYSQDELIGLSIFDTIPPTYLKKSQINYIKYVNNEIDALESYVYTKNKESIPVGVFITEITYKNERCNLLFLQDITLQRKAEQKLMEAKIIAEQNAQFKSMFLANMSHEIRTPMNAVIGFTDLLKETTLSSAQEEYVQIINDAGENLLVIINDILDISKIQAGKMELRPEPVQISQIIRQTKRLYLNKAAEKGIELIELIDQHIPSWINFDGSRLGQVINNLVSNAIKFTNQGSVTIQASLVHASDDNCSIEIMVKDTGIGIPENKIESIFQDFGQVDSSTQRKQAGTGLGLAIVEQLASLMGSTISVQSKINEGSVFKFTIDAPLSVPPLNIENHTFSKTLENMQVLLCEDNEVNIKLAVKVLESISIHPTIARDGQSAVEAVKNSTFDVVLMDIQMPIMDGITATQQIRSFSNVPILAMSAHVLSAERNKCFEAGMNGFISKPFKKVDVINELQKALNSDKNDFKTSVISNQAAQKSSKWDLLELPNLVELADNDEEFVISLFDIFIESSKIDLKSFISACRNDDSEKMSMLAHKLKSSFTLLDFKTLLTLANKIEDKIANSEEKSEFIQELNERITEIEEKNKLFQNPS